LWSPVGTIGSLGTLTLEFAYVLNAGIVHEGTPFSDFSIFAPLHAFFGNFFPKLESTTLISLGDPILGIHAMEKGGLISEGGPHQ
jgi:hypothetical protein